MPSNQLTRKAHEFSSPAAEIIPNPNEGEFLLRFSSPSSCIIDISLFDQVGKQVQPVGKFQAVRGNNEIHLSFHPGAGGNYFIIVEGDGIRFTKQLSVVIPE